MIVLTLRMNSCQEERLDGMGCFIPSACTLRCKGLTQKSLITLLLLLMEEILHHLGCIKSVNNGIFTISAGAGFHPSTVVGYISYSLLVATSRRKRQRLDLISALTWKLKQRNHERTKNPSSRFHLYSVLFHRFHLQKNWSRWWFPPLFGEDFHFDEHIFHMGWWKTTT